MEDFYGIENSVVSTSEHRKFYIKLETFLKQLLIYFEGATRKSFCVKSDFWHLRNSSLNVFTFFLFSLPNQLFWCVLSDYGKSPQEFISTFRERSPHCSRRLVFLISISLLEKPKFLLTRLFPLYFFFSPLKFRKIVFAKIKFCFFLLCAVLGVSVSISKEKYSCIMRILSDETSVFLKNFFRKAIYAGAIWKGCHVVEVFW